ncbi:MAG TPA: sigma-70 family RNA polymerase sigma factor [Anaerolineales bacterium]|nr:sigma-70 family RNA polymerase sigma factor [Anaerolineales bacterium]
MLNINTNVIKRAQKGDLEIISALYEQHQQSIFRYLYYRVGDQQTAEDLTSEVFLRMLRFLSGFKPPSAAFPAWLFQIARNLAADYFRRSGSHKQLELRESLAAASEDVDRAVERKLTNEVLRRALDRLSPEQRDVIILRFLSGLPISEVARTLNRSEDSVKGLQRRAVIALREILTDWEISYVQR